VDDSLAGVPAFCSWSGGKDSALALHEAIGAGARPQLLVTMLTEDGLRSRSHGLHRSVLEAQAEAIGLPIEFSAATWDDYERGFLGLVAVATERGAKTGIFGDIDIEDHRRWVERVCAKHDATARLPLWQRDRGSLVRQLLREGFKTVIVAVRDQVLPESLLGRVLDEEVLEVIAAAGADLAGEWGEYHSLVIDGPLFDHPLDLALGEHSLRDGVWFVDVETRS
jgi:diphthine-ammonia ligase